MVPFKTLLLTRLLYILKPSFGQGYCIFLQGALYGIPYDCVKVSFKQSQIRRSGYYILFYDITDPLSDDTFVDNFQ